MAHPSLRAAFCLLPLVLGACGGGGDGSSVKAVAGGAYADPNLPPPAVIPRANKAQESETGLAVNKYLCAGRWRRWASCRWPRPTRSAG